MKNIATLLLEHPFFKGMSAADLHLIAACGDHQVFAAGSYIARENDPADYFYLIRQGRAVIETFLPERGALSLQTLQDGDIIGWSWLFPPYTWTFDVRAQTRIRCIRLDGRCLRGKCAVDTRLGYELMQRFSRIMTSRLQHTRLQLLNIYSRQPGSTE